MNIASSVFDGAGADSAAVGSVAEDARGLKKSVDMPLATLESMATLERAAEVRGKTEQTERRKQGREDAVCGW